MMSSGCGWARVPSKADSHCELDRSFTPAWLVAEPIVGLYSIYSNILVTSRWGIGPNDAFSGRIREAKHVFHVKTLPLPPFSFSAPKKEGVYAMVARQLFSFTLQPN